MSAAAAGLVLASTSPYRRDLLARLRLPYDVARPEVDETPAPGEAPAALAARLSLAKAWAVARARPGAWVIGSVGTLVVLPKLPPRTTESSRDTSIP